jgi:PhnB protein
MTINPVPPGYHTATAYLIVSGAARAIEFYQQAFGATERMRLGPPGGQVMHAEIQIGDSCIMLADECPQMGARSPQSIGGSPVGMHLYVEDCDAVFQRAVSLGAKVLQPMTDKFYGDRSGTLLDPFGHQWTISTHQEDVTPEEVQKRMMTMQGKK